MKRYIKSAKRTKITYDKGDVLPPTINQILKPLSKKELKKYTVKELKNFCKELGIKGYSRLKEGELVDLIFNFHNK